MNRSEWKGCAIVVGALAFMTTVAVYTQSAWFQVIIDASREDRSGIGRALLNVGMTVIGLCVVYSRFWQGRQLAQWGGAAILTLFGTGFIVLSLWLTTLDYPNADSQQMREIMQADDREHLPGRIAIGCLAIGVGGLLCLPPVGQFLRYRRAKEDQFLPNAP